MKFFDFLKKVNSLVPHKQLAIAESVLLFVSLVFWLSPIVGQYNKFTWGDVAGVLWLSISSWLLGYYFKWAMKTGE